MTVIRVTGQLELNCLTHSEVSNAFRHLIEKVSCPYGSFMLEGGKVIFLHKFLERRVSKGWTGDVLKDARPRSPYPVLTTGCWPYCMRDCSAMPAM